MNITRLKNPDYEKKAFDYLIEKYKADPEWFERNLPDITDMVREASLPLPPPRPSFNLTEAERLQHTEALLAILNVPKPCPQDAVMALEHCAVLVQDNFMTPHVGRDKVVPLFETAFGKSHESFEEDMTIPIEERGTGEPFYHSSLLRGVVIGLDKKRRLVSVTVTPSKVREYHRLRSIVGIARDPCEDVSIRHDDYLAEEIYRAKISPHEPS